MVVGDEEALRREWGGLLTKELARQGLTHKDLRQRLADELDVHVTREAILHWLAGRWAPKPTHQAAICRVLKVPHTSIFPVSVFVEGRR